MDSYYESSYLTWEIVSKSNLKFLQQTVDHLKHLEENDINTWKYADTSDYYFNKRPIGGKRPFPTTSLNITADEATSILLRHGLVQDSKRKFVNDPGMEDYRDEMQESVSFSNQSYAVFYTSENGIVKHIWLDSEDYISVPEDRKAISALLHYLGEKYELILIDWYREYIIDLSDKEKIIQILNDIAAKTGF